MMCDCENKWMVISKDELPEVEGDYLVTVRSTGDVCIRFINPEADSYFRRVFTAWRTIPQAFTE